MRMPIVVFLVIYASLSSASVLFKKSSNFPVTVRAQVVAGILQNCPHVATPGWSVFEKATDVRYESNASYFTSDFGVYSIAPDQRQESGELKINAVLLSSGTKAG